MKTHEEFNKDKEIESQRHELFHSNAHIEQLHQWIKSDSVYTALRYAYKSPSKTGMDDMDDKSYLELYRLSEKLRQAEREELAARQDDFS